MTLMDPIANGLAAPCRILEHYLVDSGDNAGPGHRQLKSGD